MFHMYKNVFLIFEAFLLFGQIVYCVLTVEELKNWNQYKRKR